jgi:hypothetical protein
MVTASSAGVLGTQAIPTDVSIYNASGSVPASTNRNVTIPSNSTLWIGDTDFVGTNKRQIIVDNNVIQLNANNRVVTIGPNDISMGSVSSENITLKTTGIEIRANNTLGTNGQVLTSNGTKATWNTPSPSFDGVFVSTTNYANVANNGTLPIFGGTTTTAGSTTVSGSTFTKGVSGGIYEVDVIVNVTSRDAAGFVELCLQNGSTCVNTVKLYNHIHTDDTAGDIIYTFYTSTASGTWSVKNTSGAARDFDIKRVSIKRVM